MRNSTIDFLKFISSIFIIYLHASLFMSLPFYIPATDLAVDFFFIVSGYLVFKKSVNIKHNNISVEVKDIIISKIKNVYIEYVVSLIMGFIVLNIFLFEGGKTCLVNLMLLTGELSLWHVFGLPTDGWSNVIWYVAVMALCSGLIYFIVKSIDESSLMLLFTIMILFLFGYLARNFNNIIVALETGPYCFIPGGFYRGFADMLLGGVAYRLSLVTNYFFAKLINAHHKMYYRIILTSVEILGYLVYFAISFKHSIPSHFNIFIVLILTLSVGFSFSGITFLNDILNVRFLNFLGIFSLNIYLNHNYLAYAFHRMYKINTIENLLYYTILVFVCAVVNFAISKKIRLYLNRRYFL